MPEEPSDQMLSADSFEVDEQRINEFQENLATEEERLQDVPPLDDPGKDYPAPDFSDADEPHAKEPAPNYDTLPQE